MECLDHGTGSLGSMKENKLYAERYRKNKTYRVSGQIEDDRYLGALRASYGYSITCNSAQGGEWDTVYLNTFYIPCPQWAYTGITRARNNLFIF
jgi:exodeoxyribonuclease-5